MNFLTHSISQNDGAILGDNMPKSPLDFIFGKDIAIDGQYDIDRAKKFIEQIQSIHQMVQEKLEKSQAKYKTRHGKASC
jgi:hypothetical protein